MKVKSLFSSYFIYIIALAILVAILTWLAVWNRATHKVVIESGTSKTKSENRDRSKARAVPGMILQKMKIDYINKNFNDIYFLDEKQVLKYVPPPYSIERTDYFVRECGHKREENIESATFWWNNGQLELRSMMVGYSPLDRTLKQVLHYSLDVCNYQIENCDSIPNIPLVGDWIIRKGALLEQQLVDLSRCIKESVGSAITFEKKQVTKEVLVANSVHDFKAQSVKRYTVSVYLNEISTKESNGGGTGRISEFLHSLSRFLDIPIINEIEESSDPVISWVYYIDNNTTLYSLRDRITRLILDNISGQLPIEFTGEIREIDIWSVKQKYSEGT